MNDQISFEFEQRKPIKGYPELHWTGKRPYSSTQYYPAQLKESYGEPIDGWMNKIFWGDNLQVMSHLLKEYRGMVDLIYIDPPFDSKADYKKSIDIRKKKVIGDMSSFEEKQYSDIWTNDEYLQFMYERLIIMRDLLSDQGTIYLHCDYHRNHYLRCLLDEVFGTDNYINEIVWKRRGGALNNSKSFGQLTDTILMYSKTSAYKFNMIRTKDSPEAQEYIKQRFVYNDGDGRLYSRDPVTNPSSTPSPSLIYEYKGYQPPEKGWAFSYETMQEWDKNGRLYFPPDKSQRIRRKTFLDEYQGQPVQNFWGDIYVINSQAKESLNYPTQKPEALLERIINTSSQPGDIVFDCFMGSGTTQAVAMKLGRRFIGADINLGSIQTTTKRLINVANELEDDSYKGFEVYNVNNYDFFRNPVEAKELIIDALGIQKYDSSSIYDGELDGYMVKIMPTNRIATKADLEELKANLPYKTFEKRKEENPGTVVERIKIICMGHEADLKASLEQELSAYKLDIEIVDILRDKSDLQFKREADANILKENGKLIVKEFYPMNLLQKLSMQKESVEDWRQLVESIFIDWNYDGETMRPEVCDIPGKDELVVGVYGITDSAGRIKIKITDLLSESLEMEV
ncbi:site-specific DNA-methyltransferase [Anaerosporobacter sp.]|uniref:site-specific DNA-methyltransferase n=1 Tax=Anaerosporobacter sp. TaxID=1872529 RepID=UPI00286FA87D|nr:site-specific DNA-methyltransferase [Anaerosporobacter sp.]